MAEQARHGVADNERLRKSLRGAGLRVTAVRMSILRALSASEAALDAVEIAKRVNAAGVEADRVTVYRTLGTLMEAGIAHRVDPGDRVFRFSLTNHSNCEGEKHEHQHPHFVCDTCKQVQCLDDAEVVLQAKRGSSAKRAPRIRQDDVTLHGTCERCEKPSEKIRHPRAGR